MKNNALNIQPSELEKVEFSKKAYSISLKDLAKPIRRALKTSIRHKHNSKEKVGIVFETKQHGLLKVRSQILMVGSKFIVLKGNKSLPLGSIKQVMI
jgi:hypothetical protein